MGNRPHCFKHRDVVRIVRAARAAGLEVEQVTVNIRDGTITAGAAQGADGPNEPNAWDEVLGADAEDAKRPS